jgi:hypothetical protein
MLCWVGCGFDDGKAAASRRTPKCPPRAATGGADYGENCEPEFAMEEIKKAAEKLPQLEKARTLTQKVRYQMTHSESRTFG